METRIPRFSSTRNEEDDIGTQQLLQDDHHKNIPKSQKLPVKIKSEGQIVHNKGYPPLVLPKLQSETENENQRKNTKRRPPPVSPKPQFKIERNERKPPAVLPKPQPKKENEKQTENTKRRPPPVLPKPQFKCVKEEEKVKVTSSVVEFAATFDGESEHTNVHNKPQLWRPQRQRTAQLAQLLEAKLTDPKRKSIVLRGVDVTTHGDAHCLTTPGWTDLPSESLDLKSDEARGIITKLELSLRKWIFCVEKIERIQNPTTYQLYHIHKDAVEKTNGSRDNEQSLWHGTSSDAIHNINSNGFNRSYCGKNATRYGEGVYFARDASYSVNYSIPDAYGTRHMYLAKVLTGMFTAGYRGMRDTPLRVPDKSLHYDSVVNDVSDPMLFVIFKDHAAYPEYLITFKCSCD